MIYSLVRAHHIQREINASVIFDRAFASLFGSDPKINGSFIRCHSTRESICVQTSNRHTRTAHTTVARRCCCRRRVRRTCSSQSERGRESVNTHTHVARPSRPSTEIEQTEPKCNRDPENHSVQFHSRLIFNGKDRLVLESREQTHSVAVRRVCGRCQPYYAWNVLSKLLSINPTTETHFGFRFRIHNIRPC